MVAWMLLVVATVLLVVAGLLLTSLTSQKSFYDELNS